MNIFSRLRRKTVYILPSASASMVSQYANGFRDGRTQGYAAGLDAAWDAVAGLPVIKEWWEAKGDYVHGIEDALAAIDALRGES